MKTKNSKKQSKQFHEHLNALFRLRLCLLLAAGMLPVAFTEADNEVLAAKSERSESTGQINLHMNEERLHPQASVNVLRLPTISGK